MTSFDVRATLTRRILGASVSRLQPDIAARNEVLVETIPSLSLLAIGAAGSIGSAFVRRLAAYRPRRLHLIDLSENGLVECVRDLRSSGVLEGCDFKTFCVDLRHAECPAFLKTMPDYDGVFNFAALKHVRSERDPFTLARLFDTNVLAVRRLLRTLETRGAPRFFSVSTDKAVRPANMMGLSKAAMERVMWSFSDRMAVSSARFANVAFSAGSLLDGFLYRLARGQPLAAPSDIRRYFISHDEAADLCLLAGFFGESRDVFVPRFIEEKQAVTMAEVAVEVLAFHGLSPELCDSEEQARRSAERRRARASATTGRETAFFGATANLDAADRSWPCYFAPSDTAGEKDIEEFHTESDILDVSRFETATVVKAPSLSRDEDRDLNQICDRLEAAAASGRYDENFLRDSAIALVPDHRLVIRNQNLDQKM